MPVTASLKLAQLVGQLAASLRSIVHGTYEFRQFRWLDRTLTVEGKRGLRPLMVRLRFIGSPTDVSTVCSICGKQRLCMHAMAALVAAHDGGIPANIEANSYAPGVYTSAGTARPRPVDQWKARLGNLTSRLEHILPAAPPAAAQAPPSGREVVYVLQLGDRHRSDDLLAFTMATRPLAPPTPAPRKAGAKPAAVYRNFTGSMAVLAASPDPLDREIAERASVKSASPYSYDDDYHETRASGRFTVSVDSGGPLLARLARSGRLFINDQLHLHDGIRPAGWIGDEKFDLKFELADHDVGGDGDDADVKAARHLRLGLCAVSPSITVRGPDLKGVWPRIFLDGQDRIGLFATAAARHLVQVLSPADPIILPRSKAGDVIGRVASLPLGVGIEFVNCDDVRPRRIESQPKPRMHVKATGPTAETFGADVRIDYDGVQLRLDHPGTEWYDKPSGSFVAVDQAAHQRFRQALTDAGVKFRNTYYQGPSLAIPKRKVVAVVHALIHAGWHVEADGKVYRSASTFDINVVSGIDWFELQGTARFEGGAVSLPTLLRAVRAGESSVVLDDGSIGLIPEAWARQFGRVASLATMSTEDGAGAGSPAGDVARFGQTQVGLLDAMLAEQAVGTAVAVDERFAAARDSLRRFERVEPLDPPPGFVGDLRPYQKLALGWFAFLRDLGFGGCLADDMGLGKTVQVLAMLEGRRQARSGPSLIVVPRSLVFNWTAEAAKFAPGLRVLDQSHAQRHKGTEHLANYDLVLTTYGTLRRDAAFLRDFEFDYVVLDESQAIKNSATEAAKAARLLRGRHRLALSGTPIENHLGELWSLFEFLNPGMLGRVGRFAKLAADAGGRGDATTELAIAEDRRMLAAAVRPFVLRRTKLQVAPELPERVEQTVVVDLDPEHRKAYDELRDYYRQALLTKIESVGIGKSQIVILEALLRLRQAACHPGLVDKTRAKSPSAKVDELATRVAQAVGAGERTLVFSQFTSLLTIVKRRLTADGIDFLYLDGKTRDRQALVDQFQSGEGPAVFLISLKAGGVGLNLTAARTVYLLDPWWNPAVEAQAIDRAHRIGQRQTVFATRLIAADTVEQRVLDLQARKRGLADAILNADNAGIASLTREDLELLLA